ncbi:GIN domain-containing protein [Musicola paradisiaca]|nr:DUF2807 domain-containing protein [Musicola paradisiaca]
MKTLFFSVLALLPLTVACSPTQQKSVELTHFSALNLSRGLEVTVQCGNENRVSATARPAVLEKLVIQRQDDTLTIDNPYNDSNKLRDHSVVVTITLNAPLSRVNAQSGVQFALPACAVSPDQLTIDASMGADVNVEGATRTLNLTLAMGAAFNRNASDFSADNAVVRFAMGADARLCRVKRLSGSMTTGARASVSPTTDVHIDGGLASLVEHSCPAETAAR